MRTDSGFRAHRSTRSARVNSAGLERKGECPPGNTTASSPKRLSGQVAKWSGTAHAVLRAHDEGHRDVRPRVDRQWLGEWSGGLRPQVPVCPSRGLRITVGVHGERRCIKTRPHVAPCAVDRDLAKGQGSWVRQVRQTREAVVEALPGLGRCRTDEDQPLDRPRRGDDGQQASSQRVPHHDEFVAVLGMAEIALLAYSLQPASTSSHGRSGATESWPAALSSSCTARQHQPPCHAPCSSTNSDIVENSA